MPLAAELVGRGSLFFTDPVTAAEAVHGLAASWPWDSPVSTHLASARGTKHRCGGWGGLLPLKLASTGFAARGIEKQKYPLK